MPAGTYPAIQVDFAPGIDADTIPDPGDWVDISNRVLSLSTTWDARSDEFSGSSAATADLVLRNNDGAMDPDYASGAYYGNLKQGMWFRVRFGKTTATADGFYGQVSVDGFVVSASQHEDSVVTVRLVDLLEFLSNTDVPESVYSATVLEDSPDYYFRLGESSGTTMVDSSGNNRHGEFTGSPGATFNSRTGLIAGSGDGCIEFPWEYEDYVGGTPTATTSDQIGVVASTPVPSYPVTFEAWATFDPLPPAAARNIVKTMKGGSLTIVGFDLYISNTTGNVWFAAYQDESNYRTIYTTTANVLSDWGRGSIYHIVVVASSAGSSAKIYVNGVEQATTVYSSAGTPTSPTSSSDRIDVGNHVFPGFEPQPLVGKLDEVAIYPTALSAARILEHYEAGTQSWAGQRTDERVASIAELVSLPTAQQNLDSGQTTMQTAVLGGGSALQNMEDANRAEGALLYVDHQDGGKVRFVDRHERWTATASVTSQATFGDGGGSEVPYDSLRLADDRIVNVATVQRNGGAAKVVEDAASYALHRRRGLSETVLHETDAESQHRAEWRVAEKKNRRRVPTTVTLRPRKSTHPAWDQVFARKINDRVTVKWRPSYGGTQSFDAWIDGISHTWSVRDGLTTTFRLSPVPYGTTGAPYWVWDTSTWETGTNTARWAY